MVLARNLLTVTTRESVEAQDTLVLIENTDLLEEPRDFPDFSVEMETGTGKTYVYIATALRFAETYGVRKFVILVHTVAIRAGVVKTFEQTREHFRAKYPHLGLPVARAGRSPRRYPTSPIRRPTCSSWWPASARWTSGEQYPVRLARNKPTSGTGAPRDRPIGPVAAGGTD